MLSEAPIAATRGSESCPGARDTRHIVGRHCWESINKNSLARFGFGRLGGTWQRIAAVVTLCIYCAAMLVGILPRKRERTIQQPLRPSPRSRGVAVYRGKIGTKTEHSKVFRSVEKFIFLPHTTKNADASKCMSQTHPTLPLVVPSLSSTMYLNEYCHH